MTPSVLIGRVFVMPCVLIRCVVVMRYVSVIRVVVMCVFVSCVVAKQCVFVPSVLQKFRAGSSEWFVCFRGRPTHPEALVLLLPVTLPLIQ